MDLLLTTSLEHFAGVIITLWTTCAIAGRPWSHGVRIVDLELAKEMTSPWHAVGALSKRNKVLGWRKAGWSSLVRFVICFSLSICVLLQGLAVRK